MKQLLCPCHSQKLYSICCKPFHEGTQAADNALELMRSRYSAYALGLISYIIKTTHPTNPLFKKRAEMRQADILQFCHAMQFEGLDIVEFIDGKEKAFVTFVAHLMQSGRDATFQETSTFYKVDNFWFYVSGKTEPRSKS